jgi:hypothetical protein
MTIDPTIICPNCKTEIKLTESQAAQEIAQLCVQYPNKWLER